MIATMLRSLVHTLTRAGWAPVDARAHDAAIVLTWGDETPPRARLIVRAGAVTLVEIVDDETLLTRWEQVTPANLSRVRAYIDAATGDDA